MNQENETSINHLVESENCFLYTADEPDGELTYHMQINNVTLHFFNEEWVETLEFLREVIRHFDKKEKI